MAKVQPWDGMIQLLANVAADDTRAVAYGEGIRAVTLLGPGSLSIELVEPCPFGSDAITRMAIMVSPPSVAGCFVSYGFVDATHFNVGFLDAAGDPFPGGGSCAVMIAIRDLPLVNFDPPL